MVEIRIHGRGGQGVVTAADLLAIAAFEEGHYAQAFPSFGSERTGAPVVAFCRIRDKEIRLREPVMDPDVIAILDPTLIGAVDLFAGLQPDGYVLINSPKTLAELEVQHLTENRPPGRVVCIPASEIAKEHLGRPIPNGAMMGAVAALTGLFDLESVTLALEARFSGAMGQANAAAAGAAFELVTKMKEQGANATTN